MTRCRISCLCQESLRRGHIEGKSPHPLIAAHAGRHEGTAGDLPGLGHELRQRFAVHCHAQCLAHAGVIDGGPRHVEAEVIRPKVRRHVELWPAARRVDLGGGDLGDPVALSSQELLEGSVHIVRGDEHYLLELDIGRIPVEGVFLQHQFLLRHPTHQPKGPVTDDLAGLHPVLPVGFDGPARHRVQRVEAREVEEVRRGAAQGHLEGSVVQRLHTDLGEICTAALVVVLAALQVEELLGVLRPHLGIQDSFPGVDKVVSCHRPPVSPVRLAQLEGVG
jgi:hypothetical protein